MGELRCSGSEDCGGCGPVRNGDRGVGVWQLGDHDADRGHDPGAIIYHPHLHRGDDDAAESRGHAGADK